MTNVRTIRPTTEPVTWKRQLHLNLSLLIPGHYRSAWRLEDHDPLGVFTFEHYVRTARLAERGTLDAVFIGDSPALSSDVARDPQTAFDPLILLTALAGVTEHVGLLGTASTTYNSPYNLARRFLSLDHLSRGRAGWNAVTSIAPSAAGNFGRADAPELEERYERAGEFLDVVTRLWTSWECDAIVGNQHEGRFVDLNKVHSPNFQGEYLQVRGPLTLPQSPQGQPLVVVSGGSAPGLALAARFADLVFTPQQDFTAARKFRSSLRASAHDLGRSTFPLVSPGLIVVIGSTQAEAEARRDELEATIIVEDALDRLAASFGVAASELKLDKPIPASVLAAPSKDVSSQGFLRAALSVPDVADITVRQLILRFAGGPGHGKVVGTPEQVADHIGAWFHAEACDGFTLLPGDVAVDAELIVDHVVPLLRRRGLFRSEYEPGTLRSRYGLDVARLALVALV
jgi:FMN-dependent oxidoreductase (nitrilotriacetate monooxygenase family)